LLSVDVKVPLPGNAQQIASVRGYRREREDSLASGGQGAEGFKLSLTPFLVRLVHSGKVDRR
jgi:hypothetical protein